MPNKKELGKLFKKDAKTISDALEAMSECEQLCCIGEAELMLQCRWSCRG